MAAAKKGSVKVVTAPLVIAKRADGSDVYLYEGAAFLPDTLAEGEGERLTEFIGGQDDLVEPPADEDKK